MPRRKIAPKFAKRTVVLDPIVDEYVRETWSQLVKDPSVYDCTYSLALNFMLIGAVFEAIKQRGWTKDTRNYAWAFATNRTMAEQLKTQESLDLFRNRLLGEEYKAS